MQKFIVRSLAFILYSLIFYLAGIIIWGAGGPFKKNIIYFPATYRHMYSRMQEIANVKNVDLLFLGSSLCYRGFDPRIFQHHGYNSFNMGSSNQTHLQSEVLLKQYLSSLHPKLVVYEVSPVVFEVDGVESALDILSNNKINFATLIMTFRLNNIKVFNSLVYAYFKQLTGTNQNLTEPVTRGILTYVKGGYEQSPMNTFKNDSVYLRRNYVFKKSQLNAFRRNLKLLQSQNIPYILVQAPNSKLVYNSIQNIAQIDSFYNTSGTYFNFNSMHGFEDTLHFYDESHLNQQGVILFNEKLVAILDTLKRR